VISNKTLYLIDIKIISIAY